MQVRLHPAARAELHEAADWYALEAGNATSSLRGKAISQSDFHRDEQSDVAFQNLLIRPGEV